MPTLPAIMRVFLPQRSMRASEANVTATLTSPTASVASCASPSASPALLKMEVEKKKAALMPDNCRNPIQ